MHMVTYAVIFLLGAVTTVIIMRLLFVFLSRPLKKNQEDQYLKRIASALE